MERTPRHGTFESLQRSWKLAGMSGFLLWVEVGMNKNKYSFLPFYNGKEVLPLFIVSAKVLSSKEKSVGKEKKIGTVLDLLPQDV